MSHQPQSFYSHKGATTTGGGTWVDVTAFSEDAQFEIVISGTATVIVESSNDTTNPDMTVDVSNGGYTATSWPRIPAGAMFVRTNIISGTPGFSVSSCVGRGVSDLMDRFVSAQGLISVSSGAQ